MPVKATEVQTAIIAQISANTDIAAEFTGKIGKGVGRNFNFNDDVRGIRVYLHGERHEMADATSYRERAYYDYLLIVLFYEADDTVAEEKKADYGRWLVDSVKSDLTLGGEAQDTFWGATRYMDDPQFEGARYVVIPVSAMVLTP